MYVHFSSVSVTATYPTCIVIYFKLSLIYVFYTYRLFERLSLSNVVKTNSNSVEHFSFLCEVVIWLCNLLAVADCVILWSHNRPSCRPATVKCWHFCWSYFSTNSESKPRNGPHKPAKKNWNRNTVAGIFVKNR